jgi:AraC family transcriptional regulator
LYVARRNRFLANLAHEVEQALAERARTGESGGQTGRLLARGDGWLVEDVVCTCGPRDRPFEEQHSWVSIAIVASGTFEYRADSRAGSRRVLMTPGSLMLGSSGQYFECAHAHGAGDRCISFRYSPQRFAAIASELGAGDRAFGVLRLPPQPTLSPVVGRSCGGLLGRSAPSWEELSLQLVVGTVEAAAGGAADRAEPSREAVARVSRIVRAIERRPAAALSLAGMARAVELSPFHFLRTFERVTGVTPHQYVLRARLRAAAARLLDDDSQVVDVALDCGFGDVSNFNRAFRTEFGLAPRAFRTGHIKAQGLTRHKAPQGTRHKAQGPTPG